MPEDHAVRSTDEAPHVRVADLMTREVLAVRSDCTLTAAMNAVLGSRHRHVVVVDPNGVLVGILHTTVVATAMMTRLASPRATIGTLVAGGDPPTISPFATIHVAASVMLDLEIDALGVVDADGTLVGLLTWSDIGRMVADHGRA